MKGFTTDEQNTESASDDKKQEPGRLKRSKVIDFQVQLKSKSSEESSSDDETSDSDTSNDEVKKPKEVTYANLSEIQPKVILPDMTPEVIIPDVNPKVIIPEVTPRVIPEMTTEFEVQPVEVITEIQHPKVIIPDVTQTIIPEVTQKVIPEVEVRPDVIQEGQRRSSLLREVSIDDGFEIQMCVPAVVRTSEESSESSESDSDSGRKSSALKMTEIITGNGSSVDTSSSSSGEDQESDQIKDMKMSLKNLEKKLSSLKEDHEGRNNQYLIAETI